MEEDGFVHLVALRAADDDEAGLVVGQQRADPVGPVLETVDHAAEGREELGEVGEQVEADQPLEDRQRDAGAASRDLARRTRWA